MTFFRGIIPFFQKNKDFLREILLGALTVALAGAVFAWGFSMGYRLGQRNPRYVVHDTGETFYFEFKE